MKNPVFILLFLLPVFCSGQQTIRDTIDCNSFCITGIEQDSIYNELWYVTIQFTSDSNSFINYPYVSSIITLQGDTIATGSLNFFGQFSNTSQSYPVTSTLPSIPPDLEARVNFHFDTTSCLLQFPCSTSLKETLSLPTIEIFPNPFMTETNIILDKFYPQIRVELFNSLGQSENPTIEINGDQITLHRNGIRGSFYYLSIYNDQFRVTKKIMILD